jgi:hypothetical protein
VPGKENKKKKSKLKGSSPLCKGKEKKKSKGN